MTEQIEMVKEFTEVFNLALSEKPYLPIKPSEAVKLMLLRNSLILEEVKELQKATIEEDIVEIADGIVDCMYILLGTAWAYGLAPLLPELFAEVHRSNMSKLDENGKPIFRSDGKVMKSANFSKPDLKSIITKAMEEK